MLTSILPRKAILNIIAIKVDANIETEHFRKWTGQLILIQENPTILPSQITALIVQQTSSQNILQNFCRRFLKIGALLQIHFNYFKYNKLIKINNYQSITFHRPVSI